MARPKPAQPLVTFLLNMPKSLKEAFKEACWHNGDVPTYVLQAAARDYLAKHAPKDGSHA